MELIVRQAMPSTVAELEALRPSVSAMLSGKFGRPIEADSIPPAMSDKLLARAAQFGLKPVFLPDEEISEDREIPGWVKPAWLYTAVRNESGKPSKEALRIPRGWSLGDSTESVDYTDGSQVFVADPLAPLITKLREAGTVGKHNNTPMGSRYSVTPIEWDTVVCPAIMAALVEGLDVPTSAIRVTLEPAMVFNAIGNLGYDARRGTTNSWEWFAELYRASHRLYGGHRDYGGLASVSCYDVSLRYDGLAGRPWVQFV